MTEGAAQPHAALLWTAHLQGSGPQTSSSKDGKEDAATSEVGLKGEKKPNPKPNPTSSPQRQAGAEVPEERSPPAP